MIKRCNQKNNLNSIKDCGKTTWQFHWSKMKSVSPVSLFTQRTVSCTFKFQWSFGVLRRLCFKYLLSLYFNGKDDVSWDVSLAVSTFESKETSCRIPKGRIPCLGGTHMMCFRTHPYIYGRHAAVAKIN